MYTHKVGPDRVEVDVLAALALSRRAGPCVRDRRIVTMSNAREEVVFDLIVEAAVQHT